VAEVEVIDLCGRLLAAGADKVNLTGTFGAAAPPIQPRHAKKNTN
jgi:hypothetical protein